jgi:hypothetical protein
MVYAFSKKILKSIPDLLNMFLEFLSHFFVEKQLWIKVGGKISCIQNLKSILPKSVKIKGQDPLNKKKYPATQSFFLH